jgi:AAA domain
MTKKHEHQRFPRLDLQHVLENIPRLDLSKVKDSHPLIDNFVWEGCTQVGYGKFGTRKTTIHLLAAWAVSQGIPFLGKKARQRMVLYLDYENPPGVLKQYCKDLGINPDDPRFTVWDRTKEYPPKPGDPRLDRFIRRCKKATGDSPWMIFDSWTSLLREGHSGNEMGEATPIFRDIRTYCDQGATCTIIDHTGKKGNDPIGTSAKMTQMDTAHLFSAQEDEISLDGRSSRSVIRIENFLKRFAPKDVGTFSIEIKAAMDDKNEWHTLSVEITKDKAVIKQEKEIEGLKHLIRDNPSSGQEELAKLAAKDKIVSGRDRTRRLLQDGLGKHWKSLPRSHGKMTFRVVK